MKIKATLTVSSVQTSEVIDELEVTVRTNNSENCPYEVKGLLLKNGETDVKNARLVKAANTFAGLLQEGAIKEDIDTLIMGFTEAEAVAMCLLGILLSYYLQFQKQSEVLEQRAYYVRSKLVMGNPAVETDYDNFQISYEKVENELRYIDDKIFCGAFGIEISAGKVARKSITL